MLNFLKQFSIFCFLDNHEYQLPVHSEECLAGAGEIFSIQPETLLGKFDIDPFIDQHNDWIFGHLSYDLRSSLFNIPNQLPGHFSFPDYFFYVPEIVFKLNRNFLEIGTIGEHQEKIFRELVNIPLEEKKIAAATPVVKQRLDQFQYTGIIDALRKHIIRGDCYEINYCIEFFAEDVVINPALVFQNLGSISPNPFSGFYRYRDQYLLCASPERYIRKEGSKVISQPIKGTSRRVPGNSIEDEKQREILYHSSKDRSENVMIVDLVRNDLSRVCKEGSVYVDELFGIYSFPQVHQMISTISGELNPGVSIGDIFRSSFPMGSMTGAPKMRVMELIEQYEVTKRGLFSGAIGYISPEKNMDFNVVIRSILYNEGAEYLSFPAGSGITYYSNAASEYRECKIKAEAMLQALTSAH